MRLTWRGQHQEEVLTAIQNAQAEEQAWQFIFDLSEPT
jgi:hypothetical protein